MPHVAPADAAATIAIQPGAVVSKVIHRDEQLDAFS